MSELEPDDSRDVTNTQARAPGEPPRTGPREGQARADAGQQGTAGQAAAPQAAPEAAPKADGGFATEGDAPNHPDRFSGKAANADDADDDRWKAKAENSGAVPEGK